jgi:hypothetical protein
VEIDSKLDQIAALSDKTKSQSSIIRESCKKLSEELIKRLSDAPTGISGKSEWISLSHIPEAGIFESFRLVFRQIEGLLIELSSSENHSESNSFYPLDKINDERWDEITSNKKTFQDSLNQVQEDIVVKLKSVSNDFESIQGFLGGMLDSNLDFIEQNLATTNHSVTYDRVLAEFRNARIEIDDKPEDSLTLARSSLESLFKHYLEDQQISYAEDETLSSQFKKVKQALLLNGKEATDQALKEMLGSLTQLVKAIGTLRNREGSAHGRGQKHISVGPPEARLAVCSAGIVAAYLLSKISETQKHPENR